MRRTNVDVKKLSSFTGHRDSIYALSSLVGSSVFYTSGGDQLVVRWSLESPDQGEVIAQMPNSVYTLEEIPGKDLLLVGQNTQGIHLLDLVEKKEIKTLKLADTFIYDIKYHRQKCYIATGTGGVFVVDLDRWRILHHQQYSKENARVIAINTKDEEFAVGFSDQCIRIFDLNTFQLKQELAAHTKSVFGLTYSPENDLLLSGSMDAHLKVWKQGNYTQREDIVAHMYTINDIAFRPDGNYFATVSKDKTVKIWDGKKHQLLKVIDQARHTGHANSVNKVRWVDEHKLITISDDRSAILWELQFYEV
ncbi:WD40 repeat domain-containing protein [Rapidithrix thailandica]|uniref:WD40 repeat domain-containing protein n=1 Tax=Rapidithrix thailandica TaxID=413964 RepID=A0AAW9S0Y8_9BACT